jgi:hypothetical protein
LDLTLIAAVHDFDPLDVARTRMAVTTTGRTWTWTRCPAPPMDEWMDATARGSVVGWKTGANEERPGLVGHVGNGHHPAPSTAPCSLAAGGARLSLHLGGSDPRAPPNEIASTRLTRAVAVTAMTGSLQCCCILLHSIWTRENWGSVSGELRVHLVHGFPTDRVGSRSSRLLFCSSLLIPGPVSILQSFQVAQHNLEGMRFPRHGSQGLTKESMLALQAEFCWSMSYGVGDMFAPSHATVSRTSSTGAIPTNCDSRSKHRRTRPMTAPSGSSLHLPSRVRRPVEAPSTQHWYLFA